MLYKNDPAKLKALETMKQAYEIAIRNTRSPLGGGSDTAENVLTALSSINLLSRTASIARGVWRTIRKYSLQQVDDLVTRAMFDPDYAETLVNTVNGTIKESELQTILNGKIIKLDDFRQRRMAAAVAGTIAGAGRLVAMMLGNSYLFISCIFWTAITITARQPRTITTPHSPKTLNNV